MYLLLLPEEERRLEEFRFESRRFKIKQYLMKIYGENAFENICEREKSF